MTKWPAGPPKSSRSPLSASATFSKLTSLAALIALTAAIRAQGPPAVTAVPSASLSGTVRNESNNPVASVVTIATQGLRQSAQTAADGSFSFSGLKTGMYFICAVPLPTTAGQHFVDSCLWQSSSSFHVPLAPGQAQQGLVVPVQHGYPLQVRVNDPASLLPVPAGVSGQNYLAVHVIGSSGLAEPMPIVSANATGRTHQLIVPYNTPLQVLIHSSTVALTDATGKPLAATSAINVTASTASPPPPIVVNVTGPVP
jgi:hypothetical protein